MRSQTDGKMFTRINRSTTQSKLSRSWGRKAAPEHFTSTTKFWLLTWGSFSSIFCLFFCFLNNNCTTKCNFCLVVWLLLLLLVCVIIISVIFIVVSWIVIPTETGNVFGCYSGFLGGFLGAFLTSRVSHLCFLKVHLVARPPLGKFDCSCEYQLWLLSAWVPKAIVSHFFFNYMAWFLFEIFEPTSFCLKGTL